MRFLADAKVLRGSIIWTSPLKFRITVLPRPQNIRTVEAAPPAQPAEYDEDGRVWVFRYAPARKATYVIDRDRIFTYQKKHKLPSEGVRQLRRDLRNSVDFYTAVREIQTHPEITGS